MTMEKYVSFEAGRTDSSCPIGQQSLVEEAEQAFVEGSFRRALQVANQCLEEHTKNNSTSEADSSHVLKLQTPLHLSFDTDSSMNTIQVCLSEENVNLIDRSAAVALQSWYEISQTAPSGPERSQGVRHLQPFLNVYSQQPMSLELVVIFQNFCRATDHFHEAVEVSSELVYHLLMSKDFSKWKREQVDEILITLFTELLPKCQINAVADLLKRFDGEAWVPSATRWKASKQAKSDNILRVLSFVDQKVSSEEMTWLQDTLDECQRRLESQLDDMKVEETESSPTLNINTTSTEMVSSASRSWKMVYDRLWTRFVHCVREHYALYCNQAEDRWKQRGQLAITFLTVWIAWRQRRRLLDASKRIPVQSIVKPVTEILEALLPGGSR